MRHTQDNERAGYREGWYAVCTKCDASTATTYYHPYGEYLAQKGDVKAQSRDKQLLIAYDTWNRRFDIRKYQNIRSALLECLGYFEARADADCDQDGYIPNEEMRILVEIKEALDKIR